MGRVRPLAIGAQRAAASSRTWAQTPRRTAWSRGRRGGRDAVAVLAYDYTVFAGTQGAISHPRSRPHARARRARGGCRSCSSPRAAAAARATPTSAAVVAGSTSRAFAHVGPARPGACPRVAIVSRPLLRRQRRAPRLLRRHHRHRGRQHRHGRPGDDRGRRPRRRSRPRRSARSTMQAPNGVVDIVVPTTRPRRWPSRKQYLWLLPGPASRDVDVRRPGAAAPRRARSDRRRAYDIRADRRDARRRRLGARAPRRTSAGASSPRWRGSRAGRSASSRTTRGTSAGAIDADGGRQGRALHAALRRLRAAGRLARATRPASWSAPSARSTALVRHASRHVRRRRRA